MADEAQIRGSIEINNPTSGFKYRSYPTDFKADVTGSKGPTPGAVTVAAAGTSIDLSELTTPGLCVLRNLSTTVTVDVGVSDGTEFYPLFELLPGELYPCRLSQNLGRSLNGTGTGTYDSDTYTMMIKPHTNETCDVVVEAFEV